MSKHRPLPLMVEPLETRLMFAIELDIVALHEFGHSLGLAHYADTAANSIMEAFYNASYNKNNLSTDVAVTVNGGDGYANLMELFSDANIAANTTSWKDNLDGSLDGVVNISYSFVPDGTKLDSNKRSNLNSAIAPDVGGTAALQALLVEELQRWANVSSGNLSFTPRSDNGANSGTGLAQNDPNFGDIRIGGHRFDGAGGVLAHAYYPPPNGGSYAGDAHFASEEAWINGEPLTAAGSVPVGRYARLIQTAEGYFYKCTFGEHDHDHADELRHSDGHDHGDHDHDSEALATTANFVGSVVSSEFKLAENVTTRQAAFRAPVFVGTEKNASITTTRSADELTQTQLSFGFANGGDLTTSAPISSSAQKNGNSQRDTAADVWNAYVV